MSIKIKRNTGWVGQLPNFNIMIDGEKVATIKNNDVVQIEIPDESVAFQVSQWGQTSNEITVNADDQVEIYTTWWGKYSIFLILLAILLINLYSIFNSTMFSITFYLTVLILVVGTSLIIRGLYYDVRKI